MNSKIHLIIALALALVPTQAFAQPKLDFNEQMDIYIEFCRKDDVAKRIKETRLTSAEREHLTMLCYMYYMGMIDMAEILPDY